MPVPGVAAPQIPPPGPSSTATSGPKRLLTKSKRAFSEADLLHPDKVTLSAKIQGGSGQALESDSSQTLPSKSSIGTFHHLPHYMKLYEIIKGAYANHQVRIGTALL